MVVLVKLARMKKIDLNMKALRWSQQFSHFKSMGKMLDAQGQLTPLSVIGSDRASGQIRDFMVVHITCKNEEDPIKKEGARMVTFSS